MTVVILSISTTATTITPPMIAAVLSEQAEFFTVSVEIMMEWLSVLPVV